MANRFASIKQIDITRIVKGVTAAGVIVGRVDVDVFKGLVFVWPAGSEMAWVINDWDDVLK